MRNRKKSTEIAITAAMATLFLLICGLACSLGFNQKQVALESRGGEPQRTSVYKHAGWIITRASMHNHSTFSDGCRTPEDLLELARRQGMAILAINDHREGKICVGKRNLMCVKLGGVEQYGYKKYLDHLTGLQATAKKQGMILLKGLEVIPYFYNFGKFPHLVLGGLEDHFTVYNIDDPSVFENMPVRNRFPKKPEAIPDEKPWQKFVDYILKHGGIVHVVHVEGKDDTWYGPVHGGFTAPIYNLHRIKRLTGFSILPMAWHEKTGGPGGLWDTTLLEYMAGMRPRPMWAMGDADYHCKASLAIATTLYYMKEFTEEEVYRCLREGRMVALQGDAFQNTYVAEWWVSDSGEPANYNMHGKEINITGAPVIRFALDHPVDGCRTRLIKNGVVIHEVEGVEFTYTDEEQGKKKEPAFYRVEVVGPRAKRGQFEGPTMPESELFVNPIFIRYRASQENRHVARR